MLSLGKEAEAFCLTEGLGSCRIWAEGLDPHLFAQEFLELA